MFALGDCCLFLNTAAADDKSYVQLKTAHSACKEITGNIVLFLRISSTKRKRIQQNKISQVRNGHTFLFLLPFNTIFRMFV